MLLASHLVALALLNAPLRALPPLRASRAVPLAAEAAVSLEPSQVEDITANAQLLTPLGPRQASSALTTQSAVKNALSGFTVSLAMIPEAVAFAFVAGVSPIVGLQTTAVMGFFAAAFGGRGGITTGASGAVACVAAALVASHGPVFLSAAVLLAGIFQILIGLGGGGKFIRLVPHP